MTPIATSFSRPPCRFGSQLPPPSSSLGIALANVNFETPKSIVTCLFLPSLSLPRAFLGFLVHCDPQPFNLKVLAFNYLASLLFSSIYLVIPDKMYRHRVCSCRALILAGEFFQTWGGVDVKGAVCFFLHLPPFANRSSLPPPHSASLHRTGLNFWSTCLSLHASKLDTMPVHSAATSLTGWRWGCSLALATGC